MRSWIVFFTCYRSIRVLYFFHVEDFFFFTSWRGHHQYTYKLYVYYRQTQHIVYKNHGNMSLRNSIFYMLSFNTCVVFCYYVGTHVTKAILKFFLTYTYLLYIHLPLTQKALKTKLTWNTCNLSSLCYLFTSWKWVDIISFNFWQIAFNYPTQLANSKGFQKPS
jgi:hypothetical protein